ncbi:c-type cytochrome biogenesis protein CcmI [Pseudogemmobacter sp. W21_MBD1_M6]|uniref:c-type cytochrome biogenesis protein CcmI n=1 Tax=Pseudogemmobacter sp. W21_MBD1_M6 TaxID=3240271 RepID=UPI003F984071
MENWIFWAVAGALAVAVAGMLAQVLLRRRDIADPAAAYDLQVYRDQLKEVDRDEARGVMSSVDAERTRLEVSRRILDADRALHADVAETPVPRSMSIGMAALALWVVVGGAFVTYTFTGAPGYPDLPMAERLAASNLARETRPLQAVAELEAARQLPVPQRDPSYVALVEKLRKAVADRPDDLQGQLLLAGNEAALGNYIEAYRAQERVIALKGDVATAQDFADLADMQIMAAGGYVSPEAERALTQALQRDQTNGTARYYSGLMFAQVDRPDLSFRLWRALLDDSAPDDLWVPAIRDQIEDIAVRAGVNYTLPPVTGLKGPDAADIQAAGQMTDADRTEMIRGMVAGLSDRLATSGGSPEEWARLVGAYGVLGETGQAGRIWTEAQTVFAGNEAALATIHAAAVQAGVAQ